MGLVGANGHLKIEQRRPHGQEQECRFAQAKEPSDERLYEIERENCLNKGRKEKQKHDGSVKDRPGGGEFRERQRARFSICRKRKYNQLSEHLGQRSNPPPDEN